MIYCIDFTDDLTLYLFYFKEDFYYKPYCVDIRCNSLPAHVVLATLLSILDRSVKLATKNTKFWLGSLEITFNSCLDIVSPMPESKLKHNYQWRAHTFEKVEYPFCFHIDVDYNKLNLLQTLLHRTNPLVRNIFLKICSVGLISLQSVVVGKEAENYHTNGKYCNFFVFHVLWGNDS